jgi:hypothetical protein
LVVAALIFGIGLLLGTKRTGQISTADSSLQKDMDDYCTAQLNDRYPSKLSPDEKKKNVTDQSFFSRRLHTCIETEVTLDPKDAASMNYLATDLTDGFVAPPKWHHNEMPLHVISTDYGDHHHLYAEGYWAPVDSNPDKQLVAEANKVTLTCDFTEGRRTADDSNTCTETQAYMQLGTIDSDTQAYRIVSWSPDEIVATDVEKGLSGATSTTLVIHPQANEVEVIDRTKMDEKQPTLFNGMAGKSFGGEYELHGGMYLIDTEGVVFQCNEDGVVTDMRYDVVRKYHGDVVDVPSSEWNAASKADHKYTPQECEAAMQKKLAELR